jgi:hypothetical protein
MVMGVNPDTNLYASRSFQGHTLYMTVWGELGFAFENPDEVVIARNVLNEVDYTEIP